MVRMVRLKNMDTKKGKSDFNRVGSANTPGENPLNQEKETIDKKAIKSRLVLTLLVLILIVVLSIVFLLQ